MKDEPQIEPSTQRVHGAYLVLFIDRKTNAIANARICSEPSPTCATSVRTEVLYDVQAATYEAARDEMRAVLRQAMQAQGCA